MGGAGGAQGYFKRFKRTFKVQSGGGTTITSVKYTVDFDVTGPNGTLFHYNRVLTENVANGSNIYEVSDQELPIAEQLIGTLPSQSNFSNISIKIEATNSNNQTATKIVNGTAVIL